MNWGVSAILFEDGVRGSRCWPVGALITEEASPLVQVNRRMTQRATRHVKYPSAPQGRPTGWRIGWHLIQEVGDAGPAGFWEDLGRLQAGDPAGLEPAIRYLERDPLGFRSGYVTADLTPLHQSRGPWHR